MERGERGPCLPPLIIGCPPQLIRTPLLPPSTQHIAAKDWTRKHLIINLPNQVHVDVTLLIQHLKRGKGEKLKNGLASARRSAIRYFSA